MQCTGCIVCCLQNGQCGIHTVCTVHCALCVVQLQSAQYALCAQCLLCSVEHGVQCMCGMRSPQSARCIVYEVHNVWCARCMVVQLGMFKVWNVHCAEWTLCSVQWARSLPPVLSVLFTLWVMQFHTFRHHQQKCGQKGDSHSGF